ncbi:MAG: hypothetical protein NWP61_00635, partial [Rickettsiaceae bacterium]|nr:hypothetical protein [Rickettsiaceae bacterium]
DDFELNKQSTTQSTTISKEQRQQDLERFKADAQKFDARLIQKAHTIGKVIHSEGHSQSSDMPKTISPTQKHTTTKTR